MRFSSSIFFQASSYRVYEILSDNGRLTASIRNLTMPRKIFIFSLFWLAIALPSHAMTVLPLYLDEIVADAQVAFQGTCTASRTERDPQTGLSVTYVTFDVHDVLKGSVGATHTIKQLGGRTGSENYRVEGVPSFSVGQEYVVFLYGVSSAGFSSPVGLSQGKFTVRTTPGGQEISNGRDFKEMLRGYSVQRLPQSTVGKLQQAPAELKSLGLEEFKQIVRQQTGAVK